MQTGNLIYLTIDLIDGKFIEALYYFIIVLSFLGALLTSNVLKNKIRNVDTYRIISMILIIIFIGISMFTPLNLSSSDSGVDEESESDSEEKKQKSSLLKIFTSQLSEKNFMQKLIEVGEFDINSLSTYKELTKILINLYLNRYYLKYFTLPRVFD